MARYAVVGNPVAHSLSPDIHHSFAAQTGEDVQYEKRLCELGGFPEFAEGFFAAGGLGLNITVPFKLDAHAWVEHRQEDAERSGAVNTIVIDGSERVGHNTDGVGLVGDLARLGCDLSGRRVLLLGAGGATQGVLPAMLRAGAERIDIANRTEAKARQLVALGEGSRLRALPMDALDGPYDLIINATSLGLQGEVAPIDPEVVTGTVCYDMSYGASAHFARWAASHGAGEAHDGLGMLVGQAAEAFRLWRGVRPDVVPVLIQLRAALEQDD